MNTEYNPLDAAMDPALEQAMTEIRDDSRRSRRDRSRGRPRVGQPRRPCHSAHAPLHTCDDFQALIPEFKAGRLPEARALLVKDHLHECVACRRVYEGRVVSMPAPAAPRRVNYTARWAVAATVIAAAGLSVWFAVRSVRQPHRTRHRAGRQRHALRNPAHRNPGAGRGPGPPRRRRDPHRQRFQRHAAIEGRQRRGTPRALRILQHPDRQRSHHPPGPRQHHRAGRQAQFRPPLCGHRRLPRGRHRHRVQRHQRRQGLARVRDSRRSPRLAGQQREGPAPRRSDRDQPQPGAGLREGRYRLEPQSREAHPATGKPARRPAADPDAANCAIPANCWAACPRPRSSSPAFRTWPAIWARRRTYSTRRWRKAPNCAPGGAVTPPTSDRSWKNCAPPASIWATRSSSPASPAPMARRRCRSSSPK